MDTSMHLINFNDQPPTKRTYAGMAGDKLGICYNHENWFLKFPKTTRGMKRVEISYTTSPLSEFIGSHIYDILGFDVHQTLLGYKDNILIVACKDFLNDSDTLIEYRNIQNIYDKNLRTKIEDSLSASDSSTHGTNLNAVMVHLLNNPLIRQVDMLVEHFWDCIVIDCLISNNDRNSGNWGIIYNNISDHYRIAPVYDNGASFSNKLSDNQISTILNDPTRFESSSLQVDSGYYYNDKSVTFVKLFDIGLLELNHALERNVPLIHDHISQIRAFIRSLPEKENGLDIISPIRKNFYIKGLENRFNKILLPAYQRYIAAKDQNQNPIALR